MVCWRVVADLWDLKILLPDRGFSYTKKIERREEKLTRAA